ncbi:MAG: flagellar motor protein MotB [Spirochaetes bacterium]|nr:flagellar motor protein MotB [Spirochaetota bacterium]
MAEHRKKKKKDDGTPDWMLTYGDMNTLLLTFFIAMLTTAVIDGKEMQLILSAFQGSFGLMPGGKSLSSGMLAELGNTVESLPSTDQGRSMAKAVKEAVALFHPEIRARKVVVDLTERGLKVSLSTDAYFKKASAELDIDTARQVLEKIAVLLMWQDLKDRNIRIEGHTDSSPTDPDGPWPTNWHLSDARALNVLGFLIDFGVDPPSRLSTAGYGEYQPILPNDSEEHMSKNRRVDIIILKEN